MFFFNAVVYVFPLYIKYPIFFTDIFSLFSQGSVLDNIDYNIEQTSQRVDQGLKHLQKAEKYQKKNRKMMIIMILFVILIIMIIVLIATKS